MKDVYNHILLISTVAAVVKVLIVLLIMNFPMFLAINSCSQANISRFVENPVSFFFLFLLLSFLYRAEANHVPFLSLYAPLNSLLNLIIEFH